MEAHKEGLETPSYLASWSLFYQKQFLKISVFILVVFWKRTFTVIFITRTLEELMSRIVNTDEALKQQRLP